MTSELFSQEIKTHPYWWEQAPRPKTSTETPPNSVEVLIIGSGYTGLSAAIETARAGRSTLVLDRDQLGWGCSSRNGGHVSNSLKPDFAPLAKQIGEQNARQLLLEGIQALNELEQRVKDEHLDIDWRRCGRFHGAHNRHQFKRMLAAQKEQSNSLDLPFHIIQPQDTHSQIGSDFYHGGKVYPDIASLHPGKYSLELIRLARSAGAQLIGNCEVTHIQQHGKGFVIRTKLGNIRANDVVLATNGYSGKLLPWIRHRVIPIGSYIIATEPIEPALMKELLPTNRVIVDSRTLVYYYRACTDYQRILFGGRVALGEADPLKSAPVLHRYLCQIFPQLKQTKITHSWMGQVGYTFDALPHIGQHNGLHYCLGYCGSGVSLASYYGRKIGLQVLRKEEGQTPLAKLKFQSRAYYRGKPWFLAPSIGYYKFRDKLPF